MVNRKARGADIHIYLDSPLNTRFRKYLKARFGDVPGHAQSAIVRRAISELLDREESAKLKA